MEVARSDCRPFVVDQHDLAVDIDVPTPAFPIHRGNTDQRKSLVLTEASYPVKEQSPRRVASCFADVGFGLCRNQNDDLDPSFKRLFNRVGNRRDRNGLVLDVDGFLGRADSE